MDKLLYGLFITVLGMGIVFIVLIALRYMIEGMRLVFNQDKKNKNNAVIVENVEQPIEPISSREVISDDSELVAVITAAVVAYMGSDRGLVVRNITRLGDSEPVWAANGRHQQMTKRIAN